MGIDQMPLASVLDMAALPADLIHAAFDDEQVFSAAPHLDAGKPPLMIKRQLVQLGMPLFQFPVMALLPRISRYRRIASSRWFCTPVW